MKIETISVICSLPHVFVMVLILLKVPSSESASGDEKSTYPEEVHQRVIDKLNKLHGKSTSEEGIWGAWSSWAPCSRSCGTGVTIQSRECLPKSKRKRLNPEKEEIYHCAGHNKRHQICNTHMCPGGPIDSWKEQCSSYNRRPFNKKFYSWEPFIDSHESCALNCRAVGLNFYATLNQSVIDGTPCRASRPVGRMEDRICVEGKCKKVGCDGLLGSGRLFDTCGICGGDNSTCSLISGVYSRANLPFGYNLIATIPPHAVNISFHHLKPSSNFLALRDPGGSYLLNGPEGGNSSGNFPVAGTIFTYARPHAFGGDQINSRGPTLRPIDVMLFYQNTNPGIKYEYRLPITRNFGSGNEFPINRGSSRYFQNNPPTGTLLPNYNGVHAESPYAPTSKYRGEHYQNALVQSAYSYPTLPLADDPTRFRNTQGQSELLENRFAYTPFNSNSRGNSFQARIPYYPNSIPLNNVSLPSVNSIITPNNPNIHKTYSFPPLSNSDNSANGHNALHPNDVRQANKVTHNESADNKTPSSKTLFFPPKSDKLKHSYLSNVHGHSRLDFYHSSFPGTVPGKNSLTKQLPASLTPATNHWLDSKLPSISLDHSMSVLSTQLGSDAQKDPINDALIINSPADKRFFSNRGGKTEGGDIQVKKTGEKLKKEFGQEKKLHKKYHSKDSKAAKKKKYVWVPKGFTHCSQSCGGGIQTTRHICVKMKHNDQEVPSYFCSELETPLEETVRCKMQPCPPQWEATEWGKCSVICGFGIQLRKRVCKKKITSNEFVPVPDEECQGVPTLHTSQVCQMRECDGPPSWEVGSWSPCSSHCGLGTRVRNVRCANYNGFVDASRCKAQKPTEEEMCDMGSCASDTWFFSTWDETCLGPCGEGVQRRRIHCSGNPIDSNENRSSCPKSSKPNDTKKCENKSQCHGSWFSGSWGECDVRCGAGSQRRGVLCIIWQNGKYKVAKDSSECKTDKPADSRACVVDCRAEWFTSQWSECSQLCGGGVQRREVKCLNDQLQSAIECSEAGKPDTRQFCNTQSCNKELDNRIQNEILTPLRNLPNDSITSGKLFPYTSGKKSYEYHEQGPTLYARGQPQHNSPTHIESPTEPQGPDSKVQQDLKKSVIPADGATSGNRVPTTLRGTASSSIAVSEEGSNSKTADEDHQGSKNKNVPTVTPGIPWKPGMCLDRMKNCHLVFKARLCKLLYYNKLCCETCTKQ